MRSGILIVAATTVTMVALSASGQAVARDFGYPGVICQNYPSGYPRGWELMVRPRCAFYYDPYLFYQPYPRYAVAPSYPYYGYRADGHHHRPYLRPGWWW